MPSRPHEREFTLSWCPHKRICTNLSHAAGTVSGWTLFLLRCEFASRQFADFGYKQALINKPILQVKIFVLKIYTYILFSYIMLIRSVWLLHHEFCSSSGEQQSEQNHLGELEQCLLYTSMWLSYALLAIRPECHCATSNTKLHRQSAHGRSTSNS